MPSLSGPFFLRLIVSGCLILFAMAISPEAYSAADSSPMDVDAGYNLPPSDGGIPFPGNDSANTRTVDQKEYGEDCANAGISDYSPTCGGQQTSEDPRDAQPKEEELPPDCGPYAGLRGGASSTKFVCVCNSGGEYPNCRTDKKDDSADSRYEACKAQALQAVSRCESGYGAASGSCATTRVDGVVQQAQATNEQQLRQSENNAQACGGTAQAYQSAANQLNGVQTSCQSSVNQCASSCAEARNAVQRCPHSAVLARSQSVAAAQQNCTSGELSRRPQQIAQTSSSLRDVGARDAGNCNRSTMASAAAPGSSGGGAGGEGVNTSSGKLKQDAGNLTPGSGPGAVADVAGNPTAFPGTSPTVGNPPASGSASGSSGIDEVYNVSGKNAMKAGSGVNGLTTGNAALAALPGTPVHTDNNEDTEVQSAKEAAGHASSGVSSAGRRGGRMMLLPSGVGAKGGADTDAVTGAGLKGEETPDLSAFLPGQRRIAGGIFPGTNGCRIPDPQKPAECAVPHGPSADIWSKMKERFEEFRFMRPSQFFMNEE